jgi:D-alanyl-D-alanine endopeptidase (penicillin-binding protein 7)
MRLTSWVRGFVVLAVPSLLLAQAPIFAATAAAPTKSKRLAQVEDGIASIKGNPGVKSNAVLVIDGSNSNVIYSRRADVAAPIASITKLMTALVVLEGQQPLDEKVEITKEDRSFDKGAYSRLAIGTKLSRGDLLHLALMSSENRAAHAVGRAYPGGLDEFVKTMNLKARALGMTHTHFVDPTGLSSENQASPNDLAKLVIAAQREAAIREFSTDTEHSVRVGRKMLSFHNTNILVKSSAWDIQVQKTGFISEAGKCLVMQAKIDGRPIIIVLLDSYGKYTRVADAKRIRKWMEGQPLSAAARS